MAKIYTPLHPTQRQITKYVIMYNEYLLKVTDMSKTLRLYAIYFIS